MLARLTFVLALIIGGCVLAEAAVINVANCTDAARDTAYAAASNDDTLQWPACTGTWTTQWTVTKALTILGAGCVLDGNGRPTTTCSTIITNGASGPNDLITITLVANKTTRLSGFEFLNTVPGTFDLVRIGGCNSDDRRLRIDHNRFSRMHTYAMVSDTVIGLIDHNVFTVGNAGGGAPTASIIIGYTWATQWNSCGSNTYGDHSEADPSNFGSEDFLFYENNEIVNESSTHVAAMDCQYGGRYVMRFNVLDDAHIECHGNEAERYQGIRAIEVYDNEITGTPAIYLRGGTMLAFRNETPGVANYSMTENLLLQHGNYPFGGATGENVWDSNSGSNPFATGTCASVGTLSCTVTGTPWAAHAWIGYTITRTSGLTVTSMTLSGATLTVDTSTAHGLRVGKVQIVYALSGGTGYTSASNVATTGGTGTGLTVNTTASGGVITAITVNNRGQNYTAADAITITGGNGNATFLVYNVAPDVAGCWGADQYYYNYGFNVASIVDADTFTITNFYSGGNASGTIKCAKGMNFASIDDSAISGGNTVITFAEAPTEGLQADTNLAFTAGSTFKIMKVLYVHGQVGIAEGTDLAGDTLPSGAGHTPPTGWPNQVVNPVYTWLNTDGGSTVIPITNGRAGSCNGVCTAYSIIENTNYYNYSATATTPATNQTVGVRSGTLANIPGSCTVGVAYWATDQGSWNAEGADGVLYKCTSTNTWTLYYTPFAYPHPMISGISLATIDPDFGDRNTTVMDIELVGTQLEGTDMGASTVVNVSGSGVTPSCAVDSDTMITCDFVIASDATLGARSVTVTTDEGVSNPVTFTVLGVDSPVLAAILPAQGTAGATYSMTFTGTDLDGGNAAINDDCGQLTFSSIVVVSATKITALGTIAAGGPASCSITIETDGGESNALTFTVEALPLRGYGLGRKRRR